MKKQRTLDKIEEKRQIKRLFFTMIISAFVCSLLGTSVLLYFFAPREGDTYILTVPYLVGMPEDGIAQGLGINIKREWIYSADVPRGRIISQTPYAGARRKVKNGGTYEVTVYISLGEKTGRIPELKGMDEISAAIALRRLNVRIRSVSIYDGESDGKVIYTSPSENSEVSPGETVTMFISRKKVMTPVTVPDFCGMRLCEAYKHALSIGLCLAGESCDELDAEVRSQSIPAGARVKQGSYICFNIKDNEDEREWPPRAEE